MAPITLSTNRNFQGKSADKYKLANGWETLEGGIRDIHRVLSAGNPVCVAQLRLPERKDINFVSSQLIGLDFDHGPAIEYFAQADSFTKKYAALVMSTASSTVENPRTRVLFVLDKPVTDPDAYKALVLRLVHRYSTPEADKNCAQITQIFFGNQFGQYAILENNVLPIDVILHIDIPKPRLDPSKIQIIFEDDHKSAKELLWEGSSKGSRNQDALSLVGRYANMLDKPEIEFMMRAWYNRLKDKNDFPFSDIQGMINRMYDQSRGVRDKVERTLRGEMSEPLLDKPSPENVRAKVASFTEFVTQTETPVEWLIEDWLPRATTAMMVAPPGHYKTWISLAIALSVGTGKALFGKYRVPRRGKVLIIQQEDAQYITRQRSSLIFAELSKGDPVPTPMDDLVIDTGIIVPQVDYWKSDTTFRFDDAKAMLDLEALIEDKRYDLVIIDPLYAATDSSDYMSKDANRMVALKRFRDRFGTAFLILHHTKKAWDPAAKTGRAMRNDLWGSQFMNAWMETGIQIRSGEDGKSISITRHFKVSDKSPTSVFTFDISAEGPNRHFNVIEQSTVQPLNGSDPIELFNRYGKMTVGDYAIKAGISTSTASRRLAKLVQKGVLVQDLKTKTYSLLTVQIDI